MIAKENLGKRLRDVRTANKMTLKDVEIVSGLSSTHISEIERGMTSPTIGALIRIAHALSKDPSYFIEERRLEEVCITTESDRSKAPKLGNFRGDKATIESLTNGVVCGRIQAYLITLEPKGKVELPAMKGVLDACFYCIEGQVGLRVGTFEGTLAPGDSLHGNLSEGPTLRGEATMRGRVVLILDPKEDSRPSSRV